MAPSTAEALAAFLLEHKDNVTTELDCDRDGYSVTFQSGDKWIYFDIDIDELGE